MTIAEERIERLADLARAAADEGRYDRSREYVRLARRIAERHRLSLPRSLSRFACEDCDVSLRPGDNARVRLRGDAVVITCDCGAHHRYGYD